MSSSTHTKASVAVLGGTGLIGEQITTILLTEFRDSFPTVRVLTRDTSSAKSRALAQKGAELAVLDAASIDSALAGIDVVVNALPTALPLDVRRRFNEAAVKSSAKVYFLSEYGLDHRLMHFDGYDHPEWSGKKVLAAEARALAAASVDKKTKIIALYTGMFLDIILEPSFGVDLAKNVYTPYGPANQRFATTSTADIGRAVASLALLALDAPARVPDEVRVAGASITFEDVRDVAARVKRGPKGEIRSEDLESVDRRLRESKGKGDFFEYIRVALGKNWADFRENDDELVNPGQTLWKWKTLEDQVRARVA